MMSALLYRLAWSLRRKLGKMGVEQDSHYGVQACDTKRGEDEGVKRHGKHRREAP